ncbi:MAG TPA: FHA domain-containing protein, partial [Bacteroidia bacterium]|nr:FHA domain-containing protein [Bacteroidia bacterium]
MRLLHIGRATSNDIVIADTTVSRQHAQLMIDDGGQVTLIDLSSSNGTFVNGRRISSPTRLDPTDIVKVGEYLLPWRQHVQASPQTQVGQGDRVAAAVVSEPQSRPASYDSAPAKSSNKKLFIAFGAIGGLALVVVIVAVLIFAGGGKPDFVG